MRWWWLLVILGTLACGRREAERAPAPPDAVARSEDPWAKPRARMVDEQIAARGVADARVLDAMRRVPRHELGAQAIEIRRRLTVFLRRSGQRNQQPESDQDDDDWQQPPFLRLVQEIQQLRHQVSPRFDSNQPTPRQKSPSSPGKANVSGRTPTIS